MNILKRIKDKLRYTELEPYYITKKTIDAYTTVSVCKGSLINKNVVVTGGDSGIGFAISQQLIAEGATLVIVGRNKDKLKKAAEKLGERCFFYQWDVSSYEESDIELTEIEKLFQYRKIDIWINSHGIICEYDVKARFRIVPQKVLKNILKINLSSTYAINTAVAEYFIRNKKQGCILNISSITADQGSMQYTPYGWSKCGINAVTTILRSKYQGKGVSIYAIAPGTCATNMMAAWLGKASSSGLNIAMPINYLNRAILPQEVAALATIMVSEYGNKIQNEKITISAGKTYL